MGNIASLISQVRYFSNGLSAMPKAVRAACRGPAGLPAQNAAVSPIRTARRKPGEMFVLLSALT